MWEHNYFCQVSHPDFITLQRCVIVKTNLPQFVSLNKKKTVYANLIFPYTMNISVIIPAYNGAATISETLHSLLAQTYSNWEAIIVDDGSVDNIAEVVAEFSKNDNRILFVSQSNLGVSAARNTGIRLAKNEWLLFLDADDWIAEHHFERMVQKKTESPDLDAMVCGWSNVTPDGIYLAEKFSPDESDLFPTLVHYCGFAIHACIIRKELVLSVGSFDTALDICEDWDLWQRVARTGARFGFIKEVLSFYRMRPHSLSRNSSAFFEVALHILKRGYAKDDRVKNAHPDYLNGLNESEELKNREFYWVCWCAGQFLSDGHDASHLLDFIESKNPVLPDPAIIASSLVESICMFSCIPINELFKIWNSISEQVNSFLHALEVKSKRFGLAGRSIAILKRKIIEPVTVKDSFILDSAYVVSLEVTQPISDIFPPVNSTILFCQVTIEQEILGTIELPVCGKLVPAWLIKDVIASKFAWSILGKFFEYTIYSKSATLAFSEATGEKTSLNTLHNTIGWTIFLQQLWNIPEGELSQFYNPESNGEEIKKRIVANDSPIIEICEELPDLQVFEPTLVVIYTIGGIKAGSVELCPVNNLVKTSAIRAAINSDGGFGLCCICVRESLVGKPLHEQVTIRERLQQVLKANRKSIKINEVEIAGILPGEEGVISETTMLIGRSKFDPFDSVANRRYLMPAAAAGVLIEMANALKIPVFNTPADGLIPDHILYMPELTGSIHSETANTSSNTSFPKQTTFYGRGHFETLFSKQADPWVYTHPYEQTKYELTLSLLPPGKLNNALEIACAEGHFTEQLAPCVNKLMAVDISRVALDRTAIRCQHLSNISFGHLDLVKDQFPGKFDLIVCSEVLYYVGTVSDLENIAVKITCSLEKNGYLLMAHAHQIIDDPANPGFDWGLPFGAKLIGEVFAATPFLQLIKEIRTPLYRVQLFIKGDELIEAPPVIELIDQPAPIKTSMEASVRWNGGSPAKSNIPESVVTNNLPILMYHRVAPVLTGNGNRYQVSPAAFEEQLQYLQDSGYYSVTWQEWSAAMAFKKGLPGRAVALTFDDGFMDFHQFAWPLLKKYGFTATIFIVTGLVGKTNGWDKGYLPEVELMGWDEIAELQKAGVTVGSHTISHNPLTALNHSAIICEGAGSRTDLKLALGIEANLFAYPYGDTNAATEHLIGACGYYLGFSCKPGLCTFTSDPMSLPRIEVKGSDSLKDFINKIS